MHSPIYAAHAHFVAVCTDLLCDFLPGRSVPVNRCPCAEVTHEELL
jgi:hypothetical protein